MDGLKIPDRRIPVPDDELEPWEYEEAVEEAKRRTAERVRSTISGMTQQQRVRLIDGAIAQDQPQLAAALASCIHAESDCPHLIWIREALREAMRVAVEAETRAVDPEDVLAEWHEPVDTAYELHKQRQIDAGI